MVSQPTVAGDGFLDAADDDVANVGIASACSSEYAYAGQLTGSRVVGHIKSSSHLNHLKAAPRLHRGAAKESV